MAVRSKNAIITRYQILCGIGQNVEAQHCNSLPKLKLYKNVETQTEYRESEAQTEPWEPPYKVVSDHNPEILTLTNLMWEYGLPAGVHEVHMVNRKRMRRAWEDILSSMNTADMKLRNSIVIALEIDEWAFRETEIQFIMDLRLNLMRSILRKHNEKCKNKVHSRFSRLHDKLGKRRDDKIEAIRHDLKRDLRKINQQRRAKQYPCQHLDIITQHSDPKSDLYAPQMRFGEHPRRRHEKLRKRFLSESGIELKEDTTLSWLPTIERLKVLKSESKLPDICIRETRWTEEKLKNLHLDLKAIRLNDKVVKVFPELMNRKYKPSSLPVTPHRTDVRNEKEEKLEESTTFIQKIIKGRAIQYLMYEGRNRCRKLIEELQSTHGLEQQSKQERRNDNMHAIDLQRLRNENLMQENRLCEILNCLEGKTISGTLDFLSKELVRLKHEHKAHAFALLAERERCMREAAEAGRRQFERNRRREFDEMFKQIVKIHQDTVEAYLEDIINEGVEWISNKTTSEQILNLCDKMDNVSETTLKSVNDLADQEFIADMIYSFVFPEIEKYEMREKICKEQESYIRNAHTAVYENILDLPSDEPIHVMEQEICIRKDNTQASCVDYRKQNILVDEIESRDHKIKKKANKI